jgi:tetratricopeptide (TPR) repeat protein
VKRLPDKIYFNYSFLVALALTTISAPSCLAEDSAYGDMDMGLVPQAEQADIACCDRGLYSKSFDLWIKDYVSGRSAQAEKDWAGVLKVVKGASSLNRLASGTYTRLEFLEGEDSRKMEKLGGPIAGIKAIYAATKHLMGNSEWLASLAEYLGNQYRNCRNFTASVGYSKQALEIREQALGPKHFKVFQSLLSLAEMEILYKDYSHAKACAERALVIATGAHSAPAQYRARIILAKLARVGSSK